MIPRLVLAGGGHAHLEVLRRMAIEPNRSWEVVVVSPVAKVAYTGMLPGLIEGIYGPEECHFDLLALVRAARARLELHAVSRIYAKRKCVALSNGRELPYDLLSLNLGSIPPVSGIAGANEHAVPVKPVNGLLAGLSRFVADGSGESGGILVIGGGAGSVEIALALRRKYGSSGVAIALATDLPDILVAFPSVVRRTLSRVLIENRVAVHYDFRASAIGPRGASADDGRRLDADLVILANGAAPPLPLDQSGLSLDERGFISVRSDLRNMSQDSVFAAGDVASLESRPIHRSGVYAVRQGPVLAENLMRAMRGGRMVEFRPQRRTLALLATGGRNAVLAWGPFCCSGGWVWRWKNRIDRRFMARYMPSQAERERAADGT